VPDPDRGGRATDESACTPGSSGDPRLSWWTAKALLVAAVLLVTVVAGCFNRNGQSTPVSATATVAPDTVD
jgi:hypothetical protein